MGLNERISKQPFTNEAMLQFCKPLFKYFPNIKTFTFCRFYYDHTVLILSTDGRVYQHFFSKKINFVMPFPKQQSNHRFHYLAMRENDYQTVIDEAITYFGIAGSLNCVDVQLQYCDFYAFCVDERHLNYMNVLLAQLDVLEKFCAYFREQITPLLKFTRSVVLPESMRLDFNPILPWLDTKNTATLKQFFDELQIKRHSWNVNGIEGSISNTEFQCLELFLRGLAAKTIANELNLSVHTVNTYVRNIKQRFCLGSRLSLLKSFEQSFFK